MKISVFVLFSLTHNNNNTGFRGTLFIITSYLSRLWCTDVSFSDESTNKLKTDDLYLVKGKRVWLRSMSFKLGCIMMNLSSVMNAQNILMYNFIWLYLDWYITLSISHTFSIFIHINIHLNFFIFRLFISSINNIIGCFHALFMHWSSFFSMHFLVSLFKRDCSTMDFFRVNNTKAIIRYTVKNMRQAVQSFDRFYIKWLYNRNFCLIWQLLQIMAK